MGADMAVNGVIQTVSQLLDEGAKLIGVEKEVYDLLRSLEYLLHEFSGKHLDDEIRSTLNKIERVVDKFLKDAKLHQEKNPSENCFCYDRKINLKNLAEELKGFANEVDRIPGKYRQDETAKSAMTDYYTWKLRLLKKGALAPQHLTSDDNEVGVIKEVAQKVIMPPIEGPEDQDNEVVGVVKEEAQKVILPPIEGPEDQDNEVVGVIKEEAQKVIMRLIEGPEDLDIVPIVGMIGLGKTTLARKIYYDPQISGEFPNKIWINVGQSYDKKKIFLNILGGLMKRSIKEYRDKDVKELATLICNDMGEVGRCFVVLEDVWETAVVNSVKEVFPENKKGHRIMMTTRLEYVATDANEDPHYLEFLTPTESFKLLEMKVFGRRRCPDDLQVFGKSIASKCSGLPLSLVVIAKKLKHRTDRSTWKLVEKDVWHPLLNEDDPESCLEAVKLSYDHLSHEMKVCFLYCGAFPHGFDIPAWKLIRLWIAERLIRPETSYTLEETAERYLNNLVGRNLLMVKNKSFDGQIKTCHIHDLLHEFCKAESTRKRILQEVCPTPHQDILTRQAVYTSQGLCIQPSVLHYFLSAKPVAEPVRSFYCFSSKQTQTKLSSDDIQLFEKAFPLIRVLDIECLKFHFIKEFYHLIYLRYLAISGDFNELPVDVGKFGNLQTLIVNSSAEVSTLDIKADIWSMLKLMHLHTNIPVRLPPPPTPTGKISSALQTLSVVAPESCTKDVISIACNLKKLSIRGNLVEFLEINGGGWRNFEELKCLEHLKLLNDALYTDEKIHLPPLFITFLRTLKKLILSNTKFDWSEANSLGELESLEVLKLKENAFIGKSWKPEIGGFSELQVLLIKTTDLETWEASEFHFPRLRQLVLISCDKLTAVPYELAYVHSLREMRLVNACSAAVRSAKEIERKKLESIKFKLTVFPPEIDS
uniref:Late blight resistance protein homolog R1A-3 n=1 Tax=Nicotiana tabacum TaxID=4097 RepID=A0A1S3ZBK9_TOBAC|nr:PREDICTED: putative late blight resistance protein homolog R1A-3 [Nicotiana tabacum]